ncbi:MAG TPA: DNA polymerase I [Cyclobacteriaceae bacterium]|nr:DNA polymerase I [Cyclobacteriaceae bacterium]
MSKNIKKLFLLDAYALIYRAHFAFTKNPRINSKGRNTSVPFGFTNTLLEVLQKQKPTHIAVCFDTAAPTFRDEIFEEYKATRQETPEDIRYGIPIVKEIIEGFNIPILEMDGYEADDVIGTLATRAAKEGFEVYMMTSDKDFGQLVQENVFLYKPAYMGNAVDVMGVAEVREKWDIDNVSQVIDMLGLQGDTSDNIPGIPGIGPKTAATLLKKYGSVENIVKHAHELKGKQRERVEEFGEQAILSKKLATIVTDVPIEFNEEKLKYTPLNEDALRPIFEELEFRAIMTRAFATSGGAIPPPEDKSKGNAQLSMFGGGTPQKAEEVGKGKYHEAKGGKERRALIVKLGKQPEFAFEAVISNEPHFDFELKALVFSIPGETYYIPIESEKIAKSVVDEFSALLEDDQIAKCGHNVKQSMLALKKHDVELRGILFDTMLAHYLIEAESSHELDILANQFLDYQLISSENEINNVCERVEIILPLKQRLKSILEEKGHSKLMSDIEMPLVGVLASMESQGVLVDTEVLLQMSKTLKKDSEKVQKEIYKLADTEFNIASPKQVGEILFDKLKLVDKPKKTKTGQYATGEDVLIKLAGEHEIVRKMLEFREYEKLRSTYVDALPKMISKTDGRIHTDYRQTVAATGRLSSMNPNLQNIPIRTEKGRLIRSAFVPRNKDYLFMSADYSQIELRIAATFAKDEIMIEAFREGRDIHATTAAKVFDVPLKEVTPDMRRKAKEVNFGILYGSTAFGLAQNLNISRTEAVEIIESYFKEFFAIKRYMDDTINRAREKEYVETILGRRRYLRDINSRNVSTRGFAERNAINAPIQGSAADIIKIAMVHIQSWLEKEKLKTKMILQVHDELIFDLHKDEEEIVKPKVVELMKTAVIIDVPMEVEVGVGKNWLEAH